MGEILEELEAWLREQPIWLREAAIRLVHYGEITGKDFDDLITLCKQEATMPEGSFADRKDKDILDGFLKDDDSTDLRLIAISDLKGINALNPRKSLMLDEGNPIVVYGQTGSGKSGYVRVLKHACGARNPGKLYSDITGAVPEAQGCKFAFEINGHTKETQWLITDGVHSDLSAIQIYDTDCADVYINAENELTYEPRPLSFLGDLVLICDRVCDAIDREIASKGSTKPQLPDNLKNTSGGKWYIGISHQTSEENINATCQWSDEELKKLKKIRQRLIEPEPKIKAQALRAAQKQCCKILDNFASLSYSLSAQSCAHYLQVKNIAHHKRKAAAEDASKVFEGSPLSGVGAESWRLLWEQARNYSEHEVYRDKKFPHTEDDARCVLCQQDLDIDARKRLQSFEEFVTGALEREASMAEAELELLTSQIEAVMGLEDLTILIDAIGIIDENERRILLDFRDELEDRKQKLLRAQTGDEFGELEGMGALSLLQTKAAALEADASQYDSALAQDERNKIEQDALEYETRKWLADNRHEIIKEVNRLKEINAIENAKRLTSTQRISIKKSSLAEKLITDSLLKRFKIELANLGAGEIPAEIVKVRTEKGRVFHRLILTNKA